MNYSKFTSLGTGEADILLCLTSFTANTSPVQWSCPKGTSHPSKEVTSEKPKLKHILQVNNLFELFLKIN